MPAVFVHGVPDTWRVWDPLREHLARTDIVTLALPGFGTAVPAGFNATKEEYVDWIIHQLEGLGKPVDLVGHDWGCLLVMRVASVRPDLVRSWAAGSGPVSKDYEWHPLAKIWQTPEQGESWFRDLKPDGVAAAMAKAGLPADLAKITASHIDPRMADCILRLYRSAVNVGSEWQPDLRNVSSPGLVFWGKEDAECPVIFADRLGTDAHARRVLPLDAAHWVIVQRAAEIAAALQTHWSATT